MELEDSYGDLRLRGAGGEDRDRRRRGRLRRSSTPRRERWRRLILRDARRASCPSDLRRQALTHSSWTEERAESYERLAYLGDSVLGLAVAAELYRALPRGRRRRADQDPQPGGQRRLLRRGRPRAGRAGDAARGEPEDEQAIPAEVLLAGARPLPEVTEALIGACFLAFGFERDAAAVVAAFEPQIEDAAETPDRLQVGAAGAARAAPRRA